MTGCREEDTLAYSLRHSSSLPGLLPVAPFVCFWVSWKDRKQVGSSFYFLSDETFLRLKLSSGQ